MKKLRQSELALSALKRGQRFSLHIDGATTAYWFYPATKRTKKTKTLVMIHGYRGNHLGLEAIVGAAENLDVYVPDLPGFGKSEPFRVAHSIENYSKWLHSFIVGLDLKHKPHLLGHSFGSIVTAAYVASFPREVETLILENPVAAPALKGPKAAVTAVAKGFFALAGALPEKTGDAILQSWPMVRGMSIIMTKSRVRELRKWVHQQHDENFNDYANRRVALEGYTASISNCVGDFVTGLDLPVLMLVGDKDDITSVSQQEKLFARMRNSNSQLRIFHGVGHLTHYEIPKKIAKAVTEWTKTRS